MQWIEKEEAMLQVAFKNCMSESRQSDNEAVGYLEIVRKALTGWRDYIFKLKSELDQCLELFSKVPQIKPLKLPNCGVEADKFFSDANFVSLDLTRGVCDLKYIPDVYQQLADLCKKTSDDSIRGRLAELMTKIKAWSQVARPVHGEATDEQKALAVGAVANLVRTHFEQKT